ncbi:hypothetical protein BgiMline_000500, partial [Biomphalaria glabrata]
MRVGLQVFMVDAGLDKILAATRLDSIKPRPRAEFSLEAIAIVIVLFSTSALVM